MNCTFIMLKCKLAIFVSVHRIHLFSHSFDVGMNFFAFKNYCEALTHIALANETQSNDRDRVVGSEALRSLTYSTHSGLWIVVALVKVKSQNKKLTKEMWELHKS